MKFSTFKIEDDNNVIRSHFEIQKLAKKTEKLYLFFKIANILRLIKSKLKFFVQEAIANLLVSTKNNKMNSEDFFHEKKIQEKLEVNIILGLQQKIRFFESLKNGQSYLGHLLHMIKAEKLKNKISNLKKWKLLII